MQKLPCHTRYKLLHEYPPQPDLVHRLRYTGCAFKRGRELFISTMITRKTFSEGMLNEGRRK